MIAPTHPPVDGRSRRPHLTPPAEVLIEDQTPTASAQMVREGGDTPSFTPLEDVRPVLAAARGALSRVRLLVGLGGWVLDSAPTASAGCCFRSR